MENGMEVPQTIIHVELPYDPKIPLLCIYTKEMKLVGQRGIYILIFIVVLFIIACKWKQPKCPSTNEWL
jgi:hypothetical protein